jgi:hypothetical protein
MPIISLNSDVMSLHLIEHMWAFLKKTILETQAWRLAAKRESAIQIKLLTIDVD